MLTEQPARPICKKCNFTLVKPNGTSKHGFQKWHKYCVDCAKALYNKDFNYLQHKGMHCEKCGFIPQDAIQLDLVYKDGIISNKNSNNLITMCANCSRIHRKKIKSIKKSILSTLSVDSDVRI
jgi:RNase P subunit RPR2|tara:strand:- start:201 stop:569 length:369 start_codon:yes stop_codon:yes gene_type:complete